MKRKRGREEGEIEERGDRIRQNDERERGGERGEGDRVSWK